MKGGKGFLLIEALLCLALAAMVCVTAVGAFSSGVRLIAEGNAAMEAFNAASGAYGVDGLAERGLTLTHEEVYCSGLAEPFYYVTVTNAGGKTVASMVAGGE